jgi:PAS domain S-box-containing protein
MNNAQRRFDLNSIRTQFLIVLVAVVLVAVIVTQAISLLTSRDEISEEARNDLSNAAQTEARNVNAYLQNQLNGIRVLSRAFALQDLVASQNERYAGLSESEVSALLAEESQNWSPADAVTPDGIQETLVVQAINILFENFAAQRNVIITDVNGAVILATESVPNSVQTDTNWWQVAWSNGVGATHVSLLGGQNDANAQLTLAVPILLEDQFIGAIHSQLAVSAIEQEIDAFEPTGTQRGLIVNESGEIVVPLAIAATETSLSDVPGNNQVDTITDDRDESSVAAVARLASNDEDVLQALGWSIVVLEPESEVFAPINTAFNAVVLASGVILLVILGIAIYFANRVTAPLRSISTAAEKVVRQRDYSTRVQAPNYREYEQLSQSFNTLAEEVQGLSSRLEARGTGRNKDLEATVEIGRLATSETDPEALLPRVVNTITDRFGLYYTQVYLIDEAQRYAILRAGTGQVGSQLLKQNHRIDLDQTSIVGRAVQSRRPVLVTDTESSSIHSANALLPDTRSELAVPLVVGETLLGVLDMQAQEAGIFNQDNLPVFEAMATQIAGVLRSNAAFEEARAAISRADELNQRLVRENWEGYLGRAARGGRVGYRYDLETPVELDENTPIDAGVPDDNASKAMVPIRLGAEQIGNILISESGSKEWNADELRLVEDVAARVAQSIEQLRAFEETETRARELAIVAEVGTRATSTLDANELLASVVDLTKESFNLYHTHIYLFDPDRDVLVLAAGAGQIGRQMVRSGHRIPLRQEHSIVARAARLRTGVISNDVTREPDFLPNPLLPRTRSEMAIPMMARGELLGVLDVQSDITNRFTDEDVQVKTTLASQLAVSLANAQLFESTQRALRQAERLSTASQALSTAQDLDEILKIFAEPVQQDIPVNIMLTQIRYDSAGNPEYADVTQEIQNTEQPMPRIGAQLEITRYDLLGDTRQVTLIEDVQKFDGADKLLGAHGEHPPQAFVLVPLISGGRWLGVLELQWPETHEFEEEEAEYYRLVAPQLSSVVDSLLALAESRQRAIEMQMVAQVSSIGSTLIDEQDLLNNFAELTRERFNRYHAQIYLVDEANENLVLAAAAGKVGEQLLLAGHFIPIDRQRSIVARAARDRVPVLSNDVTREAGFLPNPLLPQTRSEVAVPIVSGDNLYGVLDVQDSRPSAFGDINIRAKETLAIQIAVALQNARQFQRSNALQKQFQSLLDNASSAFISIDSDQRITLYNQMAERVFGYTTEEVLGQPLSMLMPDRFADGHSHHVGEFAEQPIAARVMAERADDLYGRRKNGEEFPIEVAISKLQIGDEMYFTAVLNDITTRKRSEEDLRKRAIELQVVADVTAATANILDSQELLTRVSNLTRDRFELYHAHLYLLDEQQDVLVLTAGAGQVGEIMVAQGHNIPLGREHSLVARAARTRQGVTSNNVMLEPDFLPNPLLAETRAELAIPIMLGHEVLGVLDVQSTETGRFTQEDVRIKTTLAGQVAIALQNARLFEESQRRLRETEFTNEIGEILRSGTGTDVVPVIESVIEQLLELFEADNGMFSRYDGETWQGVAGSGAGMSTEVVSTLVEPGPEYPHGLDAVNANSVITVDDAKSYTGFPTRDTDEEGSGIKSVLVLPITDGTNTIGAIFLNYNTHLRRFTDDEIVTAKNITLQISTGFERLRAAAETVEARELAERRAAELQVVAEVSAAAATILDPQELLFSISNLTRDSFDLYHAHIYLYDGETERLYLSAGAGDAGKLMVGTRHSIPMQQTHSLVARAARSRDGIISNDVTREPDFLPNPLLPDTRSEMSVPMIVGNELLGVLDVQASRVGRFVDEDVRIFDTLSRQIGIALLNARLYQEQLETAEQLREVDKLKSEFLASMSHELRTPLNSIIGYAEVILDGLDGPLNEELEEDVGAIHGSGKLLLNLINDILDLAKIEAGQMELEYAEVDVKEFMSRILDSSRILVKDKPVDLKLNVEDSVPATIHADPVRLQQIVNNLISNAAKFTEQGSITLNTTAENGDVRVSVIDTGTGIDEDKLEVIFERFRQADQSSTRRAGGTGLGLDITRRLVHMHGGEIHVTSTLGEGSTFSFTLPLTPPVDAHTHGD